MLRWDKVLCVVGVLVGVSVSAAAQSHVTLPLRVDFVHDPAAFPPSFFNEGCFENTNPTTAQGYTAMLPDQIQDPATPTAPYFGWGTEATSEAWKIFPADVTALEVWNCLLALELQPLAGINSLPPGKASPDHDADYAQVVNGHRWHSSEKVFTAFVAPGTGKVLVRLLIGRSDTEVHAIRVLAGTQGSCGGTVTYDSVLEEVFPDPDEQWGDGIWTRTMLQKASLTQSVGGWRSLWFTMDPLCEGADERVQFQILSAEPHTSVAALEIFPYQAADMPPIYFDKQNLSSPLAINTAYSSWVGSDQTHVLNGLDDLVVQDDPAAAKIDFDLIQDDVTRAEALLWLAGWLGGDRRLFGHDGYEWECLEEALGELEAIDVTTDSRGGFIAHHLELAKQYRRALLHERMGGVPRAILPGNDEYENWYRSLEDDLNDMGLYPDINVGLLNLNAAEALWRNVGGQQLGPTYNSARLETHPLFFKAMLYTGLNTWARHTKNVNVSTLTTALYFVQQHFDLAREFADEGLFSDATEPLGGANVGPFGSHDALAILNHMGTYDVKNPPNDPDYDQNDVGGITGKWGGEGAVTVHGPGESYWWSDLLLPASSIDPEDPLCTDNVWARQLRRFDVAHRAAHTWWADVGSLDQEFGGGDGDDPEFVLQMVYPTLAFPGRDPHIEATAQGVTDTWLAPWGPAPEGSGEYYHGNNAVGAADVEHSGEYTGNGLWAMLQIRYGDPWYLEYALQSTQYLGDDVWASGGSQAGGAPWTELLDANSGNPFGVGPMKHTDPETAGFIDYRRYVNWHMDAEGSDDMTGSGGSAAGDVTLNGRSILPAFYVAAHNRHPGTVRLLRQWAEWWWVVLMDDGSLADATSTPTQAKPVGVPPVLIQYDTSFPYLEYGEVPAMGGTTPEWWTGPYGDLQGALVSSDYVYGPMLWRYLDKETPLAERHEYLLPLYRAAQLLGEYWRVTLDRAGTPLGPGPVMSLTMDTTAGSAWWAATELEKSKGFRQVLTQQLSFLEADATLALEPFHANLIEYLKAGLGCRNPSTWTPSAFPLSGCDGYPKALFADDVSLDAGKDLLEADFAAGFNWLEAFFGLATDWVSYIDRIYLSRKSANSQALAVLTQGYLSTSFPNTTLRWESLPGEPDLELVALAKGWQYDSVLAADVWRALVVNFAAGTSGTTTTVRLRFRHGLPAGTYDLYTGPNGGDDGIATGQATFVSAITIGHYGSNGFADVVLPNDSSGAACGAEYVLELRNFVPDSGTPSSFPDPALTAREFDIYVDNGSIEFDMPSVHNVGTDDLVAAGVNGTLSMSWYLQLAGTPDPDESTPFTPLGDIPLGASGPVDGWGDGFVPSASAPLAAIPGTPWVFGDSTIWARATVSIDSPGNGDKLENNSVSKVFALRWPL